MSIGLEAVTKRYGHAAVVDRVTLQVEEKELFVLLGTSGSGKSTILRIIAGLADADEGRVLLRGRDVTHVPSQARGTGFVFQNYSLFRHMTIAENVQFGLKLRKSPRAERAERCEELLDLVGLAGHGARFPSQLSGGQQQRVALARALAYRPDVLLLDEPFGALDMGTRAQLRRTLRQIQRSVGVTTILVTHDQDEAFELADRIGVLDRGRLLEVDAPERLYRAPRTQFAATFVGAGNVLVGRAREGAVALGDVRVPLDARHEEGSLVHVLVRPEQVTLSERASGGTLGDGTVVEDSFYGAMRRVQVALSRMKGVRQLRPPPAFGEERVILHAAAASDAAAPSGTVAVGLRGWHVLEPPAPRLLVVDRGGDAEAIAMAAALAPGIRSQVTLLAVAPQAERVPDIRAAAAERLAGAGVAGWDVRVRVGDVERQALLEQHETLYEAVVVAADPREPSVRAAGERRQLERVSRLGAPALELLANPISPVIVVPVARPGVRRLLACTAVGEPGERAVRLAGWLARRLSAHVTLLHVLQGAQQPGARAMLHLERALATLRAMDVEAEALVRADALAAAGIVRQAEEGDHDLVVMGRHWPHQRVQERDDVALQVLLSSRRPVLIVAGDQG